MIQSVTLVCFRSSCTTIFLVDALLLSFQPFFDWLMIQSVHINLLSFTMYIFLGDALLLSIQPFIDWLMISLYSLVCFRSPCTFFLAMLCYFRSNLLTYDSVLTHSFTLGCTFVF
jgi:hypothetical protein